MGSVDSTLKLISIQEELLNSITTKSMNNLEIDNKTSLRVGKLYTTKIYNNIGVDKSEANKINSLIEKLPYDLLLDIKFSLEKEEYLNAIILIITLQDYYKIYANMDYWCTMLCHFYPLMEREDARKIIKYIISEIIRQTN